MTTGSGPTYSVVKLGPNFGSCINASGQVAFNTRNGMSATAYFYNGGQFQNLGTLGGAGASASAINDFGQVVGVSNLAGRGHSTLRPTTLMSGMPNVSSSEITCVPRRPSQIDDMAWLARNSIPTSRIGDGPIHAFLWTPTKGMVDLGTLYGGRSTAVGINNAEEVIGYSYSPTVPIFQVQGFYWSAASGMIDLGSASGIVTSPLAINDAGQVVGWALTGPHLASAFLWTKAGGMVKLGGLDNDSYAYATAINNKGQIVGLSRDDNFRMRVFSWTQASGMIDLGYVANLFYPQVNNLGQVLLPSSIWTSAGGKVDLGSLGGGNTTAAAINNMGQVVGSTNDGFGRTRAFLWSSTGGMVDLSTPDLPVDTPLQNAAAIADNGSILATSASNVTYLLIPNTRRITSTPAESFFQKSPFQRLAPKTLIFP